MSASTKLSTSVKALNLLAAHPQQALNSAEIAAQIGGNASKLRRLLSLLSKQNIVTARKGKDGGFVLQKQPETITLQDIYCAIEDQKAFHLDVHTGASEDEQQNIRTNNFFIDLFSEIQVDIETKMKQITLQDIIEKTKS